MPLSFENGPLRAYQAIGDLAAQHKWRSLAVVTAGLGWSMDERSSRFPRALSPRKKAFAREILRRRREDKNEGWWRRHVWLASTAAAFSIGASCHQPTLAPATGRGATPSFVIQRILRGALDVCF